MFFEDKIVSIKKNDKVLEIGPGSCPYFRSDVFLELKFDSEQEAKLQRGFAEKIELQKPTVYYDGNEFPFKDNEFDYVICSHVLEHIPIDKIKLFLSEIQRVAPKGYIEFPKVFYEYTRAPRVHLTHLNVRNNTIFICDKNKVPYSYLEILLKRFICHLDPAAKIFPDYKDFFFIGFEWNKGELKYEFVDSLEKLITEDEFNKYSNYFDNKPFKTEIDLEQLCFELFKQKPFRFIKKYLRTIGK